MFVNSNFISFFFLGGEVTFFGIFWIQLVTLNNTPVE